MHTRQLFKNLYTHKYLCKWQTLKELNFLNLEPVPIIQHDPFRDFKKQTHILLGKYRTLQTPWYSVSGSVHRRGFMRAGNKEDLLTNNHKGWEHPFNRHNSNLLFKGAHHFPSKYILKLQFYISSRQLNESSGPQSFSIRTAGLIRILASTSVRFLGSTQVERSPGIWASLKVVSGLTEESA